MTADICSPNLPNIENHRSPGIYDPIFSLALLVNMTGLFSFLAPLFSVQISTVSIILFVINCLYLLLHYPVAVRLFRKKHFFYWFIFLVFWPSAAILYAPAFQVREIGLQLYYFTLFLAAAVYILKKGFHSFHRIITFAIVITIAGLIWSLFSDTLFQTAASIAGHDLRYEGRAYGFFLQPNTAAINLSMLFVVWFLGIRRRRHSLVLASLLAFLILINLTGSRGGFLTAVAVVFLVFIHRGIRTKKPFKIFISPGILSTVLVLCISFLVLIPLLLDFLSVSLPEHTDRFDITARIKAISRLKLAEKDSEGKSTLENRMNVYRQYILMIRERPLLGHGFGSNTMLVNQGFFRRSSHNQYLKIAFETGIFRLGFYLALLVSLYTDPRRKQRERLLQTNSYAQFLGVIALAGMVSGTVLDSRTFYCMLGGILVLLVSPQVPAACTAVDENTPNPQ